MASSDTRNNGDKIETRTTSTVGNTEFGEDILRSLSAISHPVEMSNLTSTGQNAKAQDALQQEDASNTQARSNSNEISPVQPVGAVSPVSISEQEESAIGPATERPAAIQTASTAGPQLVITLLLHSTETRHPYIVNGKYLQRRNVQVDNNDPVNLTVYNLKDLIWRDWRDDWETRPASPTSIRLIHMGRMLDDKAYLKDSRFATGDSPHVVHMTVKPQEVVDVEDAKIAKGNARDRDGEERTAGCRCVVM